MKKIITLVVLLSLAGGGYWYYTKYGKVVEKPQVVQAPVSQGDITEIVQATGALEALRQVNVGSQVSGTVLELFADFNSIVHAGQVLAKIDPSLLQVQVEIQQANIDRQMSDIDNQKVQLEDSKHNLTRTQQLFEKQLANQQQLEQAALTVKTREAQINSAEKSLVQAKANLNQAKLNVSYTEIKSPIDGVVVNRIVDRGQTVQASTNAPTFFMLATDLRSLKLTAGVDESEIGKVERGMPVTFTVDSYPNQRFDGTVEAVRLNATNNQNVVTYPVWITVPNPDLKLRPAMTANVRIIIKTAQNAIRIPNQALRFRPSTDMYVALGLTPPAQGGRGGAAGRTTAAGDLNSATVANPAGGAAGRAGSPAAAGTAAAEQTGQRQARGQNAQGGNAAAGQGTGRRQGQGNFGQGAQAGQAGQPGQGGRGQTGQGGRGQGGRGAGQGFGRGATMTAEDFRAAGGRGGRGGAAPAGGADELEPLTADKIDDMFQPTPTRITQGGVWMWNEAEKKLTEVRVSTAVTDGSFSEMRTGTLKVGDQLVTNIIVPQTSAQRNQQNQSLFGGQQGRGGGGLQPGGGGGGGGFPQPGGGGAGGGGRGAGGGGRGN